MRKALLATVAATAAAAATTLTLGTAPAFSSDSAAGADKAPGMEAETVRAMKKLTVVGLGGGGTTLVGFRTDAPGKATVTGTITGLTGDTRLVGIDHRAADGKLYGLGDQGGIYTLTRDGVATPFGELSVPLEGTAFAVDVNPAADALRVISNTGQNLRQLFSTPTGPTAVDTRLTTPPTVGDTTGIVAAAYTNNDTSTATATTLYDLSSSTDQVFVQAPANSGTLSATGSLGVDATGDAGLDIYSFVRNGSAVGQRAFAVLTVGGSTGFYDVTLFNGVATRIGALPAGVTDIALPLAQR